MKSILKWGYNLAAATPDYLNISLVNFGVIEKYQPLYGLSSESSERSCQDRWSAIEAVLPQERFSFLDIGSQLGYFTFCAAEKGAFAIGVERSPYFYRVANSIRNLQSITNAAFINMELNSETVQSLPRFDVICCLSVFHHWVLDWGESVALAQLKQLCEKAQCFVFETGQYNESSQKFAEHLKFMGEDHKNWIRQTLRSFGFSEVRDLGDFPTHLSSVPRTLFYAKR